MKNKIVLLFFISTIFLVTGCFDKKDKKVKELEIEDKTESVKILTGKVIDGYISGAEVFADYNNNGILDLNEPSTIADEEGVFAIEVDNLNGGYKLVSINGIDSISGSVIKNRLSAYVDKNVNNLNINPLTTMVSIKQEDTNLNYKESLNMISKMLKVSEEDILSDTLLNKNKKAYYIGLLILKASDLGINIEDYRKVISELKDDNLNLQQIIYEIIYANKKIDINIKENLVIIFNKLLNDLKSELSIEELYKVQQSIDKKRDLILTSIENEDFDLTKIEDAILEIEEDSKNTKYSNIFRILDMIKISNYKNKEYLIKTYPSLFTIKLNRNSTLNDFLVELKKVKTLPDDFLDYINIKIRTLRSKNLTGNKLIN
jgi:hypothetical protein